MHFLGNISVDAEHKNNAFVETVFIRQALWQNWA